MIDKMEKINIGDKVKISKKALEGFIGATKERLQKHVYQVIDIEASIFQGVRYKLHCGTTLMCDEVVKVGKETMLHT